MLSFTIYHDPYVPLEEVLQSRPISNKKIEDVTVKETLEISRQVLGMSVEGNEPQPLCMWIKDVTSVAIAPHPQIKNLLVFVVNGMMIPLPQVRKIVYNGEIEKDLLEMMEVAIPNVETIPFIEDEDRLSDNKPCGDENTPQ